MGVLVPEAFFPLFLFSGWIVSLVFYVAFRAQKDRADSYEQECNKLRGIQNKAFEKVVETHSKAPAWKKKMQVMPRMQRPLKLVASSGKRLYDAAVVHVDFRSKRKKPKGPDSSGPEGAA